MIKKAVLFLVLYGIANSLPSQQISAPVIDSLIKLTKLRSNQVVTIGIYNALSNEYRNIGDLESCKIYGQKALNLGKKLIENKAFAKEKIDVTKGIANAYGNLGTYYNISSDYPKALDYYFKSLRTDEKIGNKEGIAKRLGNIGNIYLVKSDFNKALEYYHKALNIAKEIKDTTRMGVQFGNIGIVYDDLATGANTNNPGSGDSLYTKALDYYTKALAISLKLNTQNYTAIYLGNIGTIYDKRGDNEKALEYFFKALELSETLNDKTGTLIQLGNIGSVYSRSAKYMDAEKYLKEAIKISKETGSLNEERQIESLLADMFTRKRDFEQALNHFKISGELKDIIFNQEKENEVTRKELNYEFEKKQAVAKANQEKIDAVKESDARRQKVILFSVAGGFLLVLIFAIFVFRSLRITHKQKKTIEVQKLMVEEKQKEIIDSITYAGRIQKALLATETKIKKEITRLNQN